MLKLIAGCKCDWWGLLANYVGKLDPLVGSNIKYQIPQNQRGIWFVKCIWLVTTNYVVSELWQLSANVTKTSNNEQWTPVIQVSSTVQECLTLCTWAYLTSTVAVIGLLIWNTVSLNSDNLAILVHGCKWC